MERKRIATAKAPGAVGPYSQAVAADGWLWCSGQIPLDPETGCLVEGSIGAQTDRVMRNLGAVLEAAGSGFDRVVRCTIYLVRMSDFADVNAAYGKWFEGDPPARACVAVSELPKGAEVEIDAVARLD